MAGLNNLDVDALRWVNGFAERLPEWAATPITFMGEFGIPAVLLVLVVVTWWMVRSGPDAPQAVAGVAWAPLAAVTAFLVNAPIRDFVARPRPFLDHDLFVLLDGKTSFSFVSDHAAGAMVLAVALFLVHRGIGTLALVLAFCQGVARVLMGLHYPSDVIGGFALGTAVALLLAPLAMLLLTPLARVCSRTTGLVWIVPQGGSDGAPGAGPGAGLDDAPEVDGAPVAGHHAGPVRRRRRERARARAERDLAA